jgi:uncharacterized 2Fe-2S/4Fe-4S cluster protein (DUF4445 family)
VIQIDSHAATESTVIVDGVATRARVGASLFECADAAGVTIGTSCVKQGRCRECVVEVEEGGERLAPREPQERHLQGRFRLACRARLASATGIVRCHTLRRGSLRIETQAIGLAEAAKPLDAAAGLAGPPPFLGLALDVGTTTVALRLHDLSTGALLATQSFENPQRFGGSDVMARIRYDGEHRGRLLQRTLLGYLRRAIASLPCDPSSIREVVVAGNPTMRDLFFGFDVQPIGVVPFRSRSESAFREGRASSTSVSMPAQQLGLFLHEGARVYGLPLIGSHVGADAAACLLASGLFEREEISAVIDIGTNTEIMLGNRRRILAASCPAGPAFEGGGVSCGMPALDGAIERVKIHADGSVETRVIGDGEPVGICGSGLVDLLSELRRTGRLTEMGRFADGSDHFVVDARRGLRLSEADVNELAQAKGANAAGFKILLESYGVPLARVARVDLAGGFSRHLDLAAARRIGLVPELPDGRIAPVGNAALLGASIALCSLSRRRSLEAAVAGIEHVRLESHAAFFDCFVDACQLRPFEGTTA